ANLILVRQTDGYEQVALNSAGMNIRTMALFVPSVLSTVIMAVLNQLKGHGELERYDKLIRLHVAMTSALGLGVTLALSSVGDLVLGVFGQAFSGNASLLWPFLLGSACETTAVSLYQPVQAHARIWPSFFGITLPREAIYVLSTYGFAPLYGVWGTA